MTLLAAVPCSAHDEPAPMHDVERAFASLSAAQRDLLWLYDGEGLGLAALARRLGVSEDDARRGLGAARVALRHAIIGTVERSAPDCRLLDRQLLGCPTGRLGGGLLVHVREHRQHCTDCRGRLTDVLLVEHSLDWVLPRLFAAPRGRMRPALVRSV